MRILLDECVTKKLKRYLSGHEVFTVTEKGWNGLFNGKLMTKCVENGIDMLITIDKNILYQQSISKYDITIVVFDAVDSKIDTLARFISSFEERINSFEKRKLYTLNVS
jgi:hypothetical protein